jgi:hypothetical protein
MTIPKYFMFSSENEWKVDTFALSFVFSFSFSASGGELAHAG